MVLRQGSNQVECMPRDEDGFTWCYPTSTQLRRDYQAALAAKGLEGEELQAAMREAEENGTIDPWPVGSMLYRHYDKDDRIQLLWVVLLPGAMADDLGMSLASQRDPSLAEVRGVRAPDVAFRGRRRSRRRSTTPERRSMNEGLGGQARVLQQEGKYD